jgi:putative ABC transport system permease protein
MLSNYLKVAIRNLLKRKGFTLINIIGLATGIAVCLLILLFVQSELKFDQYHQKGDRIYRMALDRKYPGRTASYSIIPQSIGPAVKSEFPEVQEVTRIFDFTGGNGAFFLRIGDKVFEERKVLGVDSTFFTVFSANFLAGDAQHPLDKPNTVVLNKTTAIKYYGSVEDAVGKTFETDANGNNLYQVTAVVDDWPSDVHFQFDMVISITGFDFIRQLNYVNFAAHTYLLLQPGASLGRLEAGFDGIVKKYVSGEIAKAFEMSFEQFQKDGNGYRYFLQPLTKIHLTSDLESELAPNGSITAVYIFSVVAIFILLLACINFINLSTARSVERAREVGIRKTFGSERSAIVRQFLIESIMMVLLSAILAVILIIVMLPLFNQVASKNLSITYFFTPVKLLLFIGGALAVGLVAGLYPAFVLSSFKPIMVLKGRFNAKAEGLWLRNALVVFQFAISVVLIISTIVVNRQMNYVMGNQLGFSKDHIVVIERADLIGEQTEAFKNAMLSIPGVQEVSRNSALPGQFNFFGITFGVRNNVERTTARGLLIDENYASLLGLELKEGRFFSKAFGTDTLGVVLNERAVADLGLNNPIGARLVSPEPEFNNPDGSQAEYTVIGVVKDFHFQSLHQKIAPLIFNNAAKFGPASAQIAVKIKAADLDRSIAGIESNWNKFVKNRPFHYRFLDQTLADQYRSERTMQKLFTIFSALAIFIACIGLLGLAAYATQQRIREISVRKILGASTGNIVGMLSRDFLKLVLVATVIAFPLAWWAMHTWLQNFAYRSTLSGWIFVMAAGISIVVALFTISFQAIKAALTNPVRTLRNE